MFLKVFFAVLLLLGLFFTLFGVYFIALGNESGSWPEARGTIVSVTIRTDSYLAGDQALTPEQKERRRKYFPSITYRWEVDGQSYTGSRYRLGTTHEKYEEREGAVAAASKFQNGAPIPVYYDPEDPSEAVLDKSASGGIYAPLPIGLLLGAFGGFGLLKIDAVRKALESGAAEPLDLP